MTVLVALRWCLGRELYARQRTSFFLLQYEALCWQRHGEGKFCVQSLQWQCIVDQ
jgi:hypothetical protein